MAPLLNELFSKIELFYIRVISLVIKPMITNDITLNKNKFKIIINYIFMVIIFIKIELYLILIKIKYNLIK